MSYPDPSTLPAVVTADNGLVFVASQRTAPGLWWPVEPVAGRYHCKCTGFERRRSCRHVLAAWDAKPLLVEVPVFAADDPELAQYADPFDRPQYVGPPDLPSRGGN